MASNGGTLSGVPQPPSRGITNVCNPCGMTFDSADSFQVHLHYHHSEHPINRWGQVIGTPNGNGPTNGVPPTSTSSNASNSPTDSENNNQPKHHIHKSASPLNNTISAAADSSDNQPATPQPTAADHHRSVAGGFIPTGNGQYHQQQHQQQQQMLARSGNDPSPFAQEQHPHHYQNYMHGYDHYYQQHTMEYGLPPPTHFLNNPLPPLPQQEYKTVPSSNRFHPYSHHQGSVASHHPSYSSHHHQSSNAVSAAAAAAVVQSTLSPRVVTSSSPTQNNLMHSANVPSSVASAVNNSTSNTNSRQSASAPVAQCDKCALICENADQLTEHIATAHTASGESQNNRGNGDIENDIPSFQYSNYATATKEEPECDILDLDSQKMVYPPHEMPQQQGPLPPMHSLHPMQRPMLWPPGHHHHEPHAFLGMPPGSVHHPQDIKSPLYGAIKNEFPSPLVKQEFPGAHHQTQLNNSPQQQSAQSDVTKSFVNDATGNQVASSPSEFPSTTTPQENGSQFRTFETATSSLPNSGQTGKSSSWKSNEARRPKTYNCTACNKWFTSSGHLKRHYNTTLHKNAVKSSGQPDPATLPISVHHHPTRDPSSKHHRHNNNSNANQQHQQQNAIPPDPPSRSPEYTPQYTPSGLGFPQAHVGSFQQYPTMSPGPYGQGSLPARANQTQNNATISPNGQAGPSVHASLPRGLLNYTNTTGITQHNSQPQHMHQDHHLEPIFMLQQQHQMSPPESTTITNMDSMGEQPAYNTITPIHINTNITQLYQVIQEAPQQSYHTIHIGSGDDIKTQRYSSSTEVRTPSVEMRMGELSGYMSHEHNTIPTMIQYVNSDGSVVDEIDTKPIIKTEYSDSEGGDYYHDVYQKPKYTSHAIPAITALRRMTGGIYADTVPPFSPDIPDKKIFTPYQLSNGHIRSMTPQTAEIVPSHLSPNAPSSESNKYTDGTMTASTPINFREQGSPNVEVTSTDASIGQETRPPLQPPSKSKGGQSKRKSKVAAKSIPTSVIIASADVPAPSDDPLRCGPCDKVFNKACYLTQHNKTFHSGEKPYKCQRCGKRFPCDQSHDEHLAKHMGNKPFKCNQCTKQFNHKTDLRRHMCLHTGTKPYSCEICNKGFIRKDHMVKHGLTHLKQRKNSDTDVSATADGSTNIQNKQGKRAGSGNNKKRRKNEIVA